MENKGNQIIIKGDRNKLSGHIEQDINHNPTSPRETSNNQSCQNLITKLHGLVANNKLKQALDQLSTLSLVEEDSNLCLATMARLGRLEREKIEAKITRDEYNSEYNVIASTVLYIISKTDSAENLA